jgi:hypothetical protein
VFAFLLTLLYGANAAFVHACVSELPAQAITTYALIAAVASGPLFDDRTAAWGRRASIVAIALATVIVGATRIEVAGVGALVLGAALVGRERFGRAAQAVVGFVRGLPRRPLWALVLAAIVLLVAWRLAGKLGKAAWLAHGIHPLNPTWLTFPAVLWYFVPIPAVVLVVLGIWRGAWERYLTLALSVGVLALFQVYSAASRGLFYNLFRLSITLVPIALILVPVGWRQLQDIAARRGWRPRWRLWAVLAMIALQPVFSPPAVFEFFRNGDDRADWRARQLLLSRDNQAEVRYLLDLKDRHPGCLFVTRMLRGQRPTDHPQYDLVVFGHGTTDVRVIPDSGGSVRDRAADVVGGAQCAFFYRGLDCSLARTDRCVETVRGLELVESRPFADLPYNDISQYGATAPVVELALYRLRGGRP